MNGYSSHALSLYNEEGERYWVKLHFKTDQGIEDLDPDEANRLAGEDQIADAPVVAELLE